MNKEDYQKLNSYLNEIFKYMEEEDKFLLENYNLIFLLSEKLYNKLQDIDTEYYQVTNDLIFMDVYNIAREIIESINPNYLKLYDKIMNNGELNFSFNGEEDNYFLNLDDKNVGLINIMREYNYQDVIKLVHEFAHYINIKGKKQTNIGYILEEFIARKFELYAIKYLMDKEIPEEEINPHVTVDLLLDDLYNFIYSYPLLVSYYNIGSIDEKTSDLFSKYFYKIDKDNFEWYCNNVLEKFKITESECVNASMEDDENINSMDIVMEQSKYLNDGYRYILGGMIAFYDFDINCIIDITDNINTKKYESTSLFEFLNMLNIDITTDDFINKVMHNISDFVNKNSKKR